MKQPHHYRRILQHTLLLVCALNFTTGCVHKRTNLTTTTPSATTSSTAKCACRSTLMDPAFCIPGKACYSSHSDENCTLACPAGSSMFIVGADYAPLLLNTNYSCPTILDETFYPLSCAHEDFATATPDTRCKNFERLSYINKKDDVIIGFCKDSHIIVNKNPNITVSFIHCLPKDSAEWKTVTLKKNIVVNEAACGGSTALCTDCLNGVDPHSNTLKVTSDNGNCYLACNDAGKSVHFIGRKGKTETEYKAKTVYCRLIINGGAFIFSTGGDYIEFSSLIGCV